MGIRTGEQKCITNCLWLYNLVPGIQYGQFACRENAATSAGRQATSIRIITISIKTITGTKKCCIFS